MKNTSRFILAGIMGGLCSLTLSCGLIDPNIADFDLSLPEKEIVVDTGQWDLTADSTMPAIDCSDNAGVCSLGVSQLCGAEGICFGTCGTQDTCDVKILVNLWQTFDMTKDKPELAEIEGQPLVSITIQSIGYKISENTLNVDSPPMVVYVAPINVMSPGDPQAEAIGNIPSVPAGMTSSELEVELTENGRQLLSDYMKNYTVPFNLVVGTEVDVLAGDVVPTGKMSAVVLVSAVAGI